MVGRYECPRRASRDLRRPPPGVPDRRTGARPSSPRLQPDLRRASVRIAIHQPHYLPWLGYLAKWAAADLFIVLDVVQYEKNGWQNRNRIKTRDGARWLTVPVHASLGTPISEVMIDSSHAWPARHLRAIEQAYARAPGLAAYREDLK